MKKKNIDRKEKLKKIGKICLTIFNVLTGIWFFISFICIIIAACSGSLNTSGNNNGGGNRIIKDVSSSLIGNVSEVARPKYEIRDSGDIEINDDRNIGNDYNVDGIQNYNANYILTCYEDIDYSRQYHIFMREQYLKDTLRNIALNVKESFSASLPSSEYFRGQTFSTFDIVGFNIDYSTSTSDGIVTYFVNLRARLSTSTTFLLFQYSCFYDTDMFLSETFDLFDNQEVRRNDFNKIFYGNKHFYVIEKNHNNDLAIFYFSEYTIHDIGIYFNTGSLLANFGVFFESIATDIPSAVSNIPSNVYGIHGSGWSEYIYTKIDGVFHRPGYNTRWEFIYIEYKRIDNYVFDLDTRQMLFNPSQYRSQYDYFYIPYSIGLGSGWRLSQPTYHTTICQVAQYWSSSNAYFLGIDSTQNVQTILIDSIPGNYLIGGNDGVSFYFTMFYGLKNQCAFVNGFYFYIDPNGNVHTGLTGSATGGDISSSYIGDVFKLINQILTSFTGFFGYYLLPGVSIGLLFALPLIFTIILFVVKLFKR